MQTISHPDSSNFLRHVQAVETNQNHKESVSHVSHINTSGIAMGYAPRDFLQLSGPNTRFALAGDALGMNAEVLRVVLAQTQNHANMFRSYALMNTSVWPHCTLLLMNGAANAISEPEVRTSRLVGGLAQSIQIIPTVAKSSTRVQPVEPLGILATAASSVSIPALSKIYLLPGASLPWRRPSKKTTRQPADVHRLTPHRTPEARKGGTAPLNVLDDVCDVAYEVTGTAIDANVPLMSAGLDSLLAFEFVNTLAARLNMELNPTILFDHPTLEQLAEFLSR
jgi:hypothetical protein